ncbi:MAG TPA: DUF1579 family protein [Planctomycetota bacterium]
MNSIAKFVLAGIAIAGASSLLTVALVQAQDPVQPGAAQAAPEGFDMAMMETMMKLAEPGAEHKELADAEGEWTQAYKVYMPGMPTMESTGTSRVFSMLDGRYIVEEIETTMMGQPFEGVMVLGYDNLAQEYVSVWMDSMSTWPVFSRGKADAKGMINLKGTMVDAVTPKGRPFRETIAKQADGSVHITMYDTIPPQGEVVVMEIVSKKAGAKKAGSK